MSWSDGVFYTFYACIALCCVTFLNCILWSVVQGYVVPSEFYIGLVISVFMLIMAFGINNDKTQMMREEARQQNIIYINWAIPPEEEPRRDEP